jgi:omega-6 fatty acid desaturase (delta-12 desaturase)
MATSTARAQQPVLRRNQTADSAVNSVSASPFDSPAGSASNTSLSSLDEQPQTKKANGKLLDTYGNEFVIPDYTIKELRDAIPKHCFERSALRGLGYVARDIALLATTFYLSTTT